MGLGNLQRLHTYFLKQISKKLALCTDNFGCYTVEHYILIQTEGCKTIRFKEAIPNKIEQIRKIEKVRCGILFLFFQFCNFFCIFLKNFLKGSFPKQVKMTRAKQKFASTVYRMRGIITRGLYIFYPIFEGHKRFFKEVFSENSAFMYGKYSRAVCNQERVMMAHVWYLNFLN